MMGDASVWKSRAAAIPRSLWQPRVKKPYVTEEPNPKGNAGTAGYALLELAGCSRREASSTPTMPCA